MKKNIIIVLSIIFLIVSSLKFIRKFDYVLLSEAFKENSGAVASLPAEVLNLNALLVRGNIQKFNLAGILNKDPLFYQRAIEYTYPARLDLNAKDVFVIEGTPLNANCRLISQQDNVEHYVCE